MDESQAIQWIQDQTDTTHAQAKAAFEKHNGNIPEAIAELWNIPPPPEKPKTEWEERREICRAYEEEMNAFVLNTSKLQNVSGEAVRSIPFPKNDIKNPAD